MFSVTKLKQSVRACILLGQCSRKTNRLGCRSFDFISFRATARLDAFKIIVVRNNSNIFLCFYTCCRTTDVQGKNPTVLS